MSGWGAQTSAVLLKAAGSMPVLGRLPSTMRLWPWDELGQVPAPARGARRKTWSSVEVAAGLRCGCVPSLSCAFKQSRHSPHATECRDCLEAHAEAVQADGAHRSVRDARMLGFQPFVSYMTQLLTQRAIQVLLFSSRR